MYCARCRLTFGSAEERLRFGAQVFHLHCVEAAIRRALGAGAVLVVQPRRILTH